jgi:hypothetical protein
MNLCQEFLGDRSALESPDQPADLDESVDAAGRPVFHAH